MLVQMTLCRKKERRRDEEEELVRRSSGDDDGDGDDGCSEDLEPPSFSWRMESKLDLLCADCMTELGRSSSSSSLMPTFSFIKATTRRQRRSIIYKENFLFLTGNV